MSDGRPRLSLRAALRVSAWILGALARVAPAHARGRWREEWLAEMAHAASSFARRRLGSVRLVLMALGALRDVVAIRRAGRLRIRGPRPGALHGLGSDLRDAWRSISHAPGFALGVVGSLSLGLAAVTAGFSVVNTALLRPPDGVVRHTEVVEVRVRRMIAGSVFQTASTYDTYPAFRGSIPSLLDVAAYRSADMVIGLPGEADSVPAALVSGNYFDLLGVRPALGRLIDASDDERPGAHPVAVIAYETWLRHYGADPDVIGRTVKVNGRPLEIVGVAGRGFTGTRVEIEKDSAAYVWVPFAVGDLVTKDADGVPVHPARLTNFHVELIGRLRPGATPAAAQAEAAVVAARLDPPGVEERARRRVTVAGLGERPGSLTDVLGFMAVPLIVLALACLNAANLLTSRASRRIRDMALRLSLGATAWRITRQLLVESLLLAVAAALAGFGITWLAVRLIETTVPILLHVDWRVLLLAIATAVVTAVGFGLAPALAAAARAGDLVQRISRRRGSFGRSLLIGAQAALSLSLLATGWQFASAVRVAAERDGLTAADRLIVGSLNVSRLPWSPTEVDAYYASVQERVTRLPGVVDVSLTCACDVWGMWGSSTGGGGGFARLWPPGQPLEKPEGVLAMYAGGNIFDAMELPLVAGRTFREGDHEGPLRVVMVNQPFAEQYLPGNPIGQQVRIGPARDSFDTSQLATVVGVVGTPPVRRADSNAMLFHPVPIDTLSQRILFVRVDRPADGLVALVRSTVRDVHADVPRPQVYTAEQARWARREFEQILAGAVSALGALALLLAAVGLYGVVAFTVTQRRQEIGVRMALGADSGKVVRMLVRQAIRPALAGALVGAAGAAAMGTVVRSQMFRAVPIDIMSFAGATTLLMGVLLVAALIPARRAASIDPMTTLRENP
jgi:predicted permease